MVYQEVQATQVSQASVDWMVHKDLKELLDQLDPSVVLDHKDLLETMVLLVCKHNHIEN